MGNRSQLRAFEIFFGAKFGPMGDSRPIPNLSDLGDQLRRLDDNLEALRGAVEPFLPKENQSVDVVEEEEESEE